MRKNRPAPRRCKIKNKIALAAAQQKPGEIQEDPASRIETPTKPIISGRERTGIGSPFSIGAGPSLRLSGIRGRPRKLKIVLPWDYFKESLFTQTRRGRSASSPRCRRPVGSVDLVHQSGRTSGPRTSISAAYSGASAARVGPRRWASRPDGVWNGWTGCGCRASRRRRLEEAVGRVPRLVGVEGVDDQRERLALLRPRSRGSRSRTGRRGRSSSRPRSCAGGAVSVRNSRIRPASAFSSRISGADPALRVALPTLSSGCTRTGICPGSPGGRRTLRGTSRTGDSVDVRVVRHVGRQVAGPVQQLGAAWSRLRRIPWKPGLATDSPTRVPVAEREGAHAGEHRPPRGDRGHRLRVRPREAQALAREGVEVRGARVLAAVGPDVVGAQRVDDHEHEVRPLAGQRVAVGAEHHEAAGTRGGHAHQVASGEFAVWQAERPS